MTDSHGTDAVDDLQFTTAERGDQAPAVTAQACAVCQQPITSRYFAVGQNLVCPECRDHLTAPPGGSKVGRLAKATFFGVVAGLAGAVIWFAIRRAAHLEIGLV